jgi:hypothetical protein
VSRLPPFEPLDAVTRRLNTAGIAFALGGSALGHALGLVADVRDWDLTTDAAPDVVEDALRDLTRSRHGHSGVHADHKVVCFAGVVEVICQMAFFTPGGVVRIPTVVTGAWHGFPIGSPAAWAVAYSLMVHEKPGYAEKAERLFEWIAGRISTVEREALEAQPIAPKIAMRLVPPTTPRPA